MNMMSGEVFFASFHRVAVGFNIFLSKNFDKLLTYPIYIGIICIDNRCIDIHGYNYGGMN